MERFRLFNDPKIVLKISFDTVYFTLFAFAPPLSIWLERYLFAEISQGYTKHPSGGLAQIPAKTGARRQWKKEIVCKAPPSAQKSTLKEALRRLSVF